MDIGVLTVVVTATGFFAIRATWLAWGLRHVPTGNTGRAAWAAVLVVSALVGLYFEAGHHHRQNLASDALQFVTGNPDARANCDRFTEALFNTSAYDGFVYYSNTDVAELRRHVCVDLAAYARGGHRNPTIEQVRAVVLIVHEAQHINLIWNEAEAECNAVQLSHELAEYLGATPERARELQQWYFEDTYPRLWSEYRSTECREGGRLDLFPDRTEFP